MKIDILTLFPGMIEGVLGESIIGRGREFGLIDILFTGPGKRGGREKWYTPS